MGPGACGASGRRAHRPGSTVVAISRAEEAGLWGCGTCCTAPTSDGSPRRLPADRLPAHVGRDARRQPPLGQGRRARTPRTATAPAPPTSSRCSGGARSVGVEVVTLWLLSTDNLNRPAAELTPLLAIIEAVVADLAAERPLAAPPGRRARPAARRDRATGSRRPRTRPATSTACIVNIAVGYGGRREIADAVRSLLQEHAAQRHLDRGAGRDPRRRAHRRAPLHQGPARPRPGDPHLRRAAARRASCCGRARTASSTSARPTGPTSGAWTSCGRSAPTPSASAASAPEPAGPGAHRRPPAHAAGVPGVVAPGKLDRAAAHRS